MQETKWYRTIPWLRTAVGFWTVLFLIDASVLVADSSHRLVHVVGTMLPIVFGILSVIQLREALRTRTAAEHSAPDNGD